MSTFGKIHERLKTARIAAGFKTAAEFCNKFGIPLSTYNMHETGRRKLMPAIAEKYSRLLEINPAWLITGLGNPYVTSECHEKTSLLTDNDYLALLNYQGNTKIQTRPAIKIDVISVDTEVFTKIIVALITIAKEYKLKVELDFICNQAIDIYNDILQTNGTSKDHLTMVDLAITLFKKNMMHNFKSSIKQGSN